MQLTTGQLEQIIRMAERVEARLDQEVTVNQILPDQPGDAGVTAQFRVSDGRQMMMAWDEGEEFLGYYIPVAGGVEQVAADDREAMSVLQDQAVATAPDPLTEVGMPAPALDGAQQLIGTLPATAQADRLEIVAEQGLAQVTLLQGEEALASMGYGPTGVLRQIEARRWDTQDALRAYASRVAQAHPGWYDEAPPALVDSSTQEQRAAGREQEAARAEVTVYTTPGCMGCEMTKKRLGEAGVAFEAVDLSGRPDLVEQFRAEGLRQAPIIETPDGVRTSGFNPDRIRGIVSMTMSPNAPAGSVRADCAVGGVGADGGGPPLRSAEHRNASRGRQL